ncbi:hypothetical protein L1987_45392 [Smallanthus sonchifolius]|uniref:Uncharacterized protein n=1 Tax=Smallanthus sonchifolius TaxID=185202 RepID=A0ACB9GS78_9ASTR|nr:hypothetical protein L1987_45392 [Smallanthus sonchifolius]
MDTEMEGLKHPSSPANIQVFENNYGMFSPRKDSNDIQSIFWDSNNGHYNLSGRIQGNDMVTKECDRNTQPDTLQMANSVWNSPAAGLESFAEKIKKSNEIIGLKLEYFPPSISPDGGCRIHITQEDLKLSAQASSKLPAVLEVVYPAVNLFPSRVTKLQVSYQWKPPLCNHCVTFGHTIQQCKINPKPMEEVESDHPLVSTPSPALMTTPVGLASTPAVTKQRVPNVDEDGQAPAGLNENQLGKVPQAKQVANKQGVLKPPSVVANATKKVTSGFNFTRAVQGDMRGKNQQHPSTKFTTPPKSIDIDTANQFLVLDIPNSIKCNKLIAVQDDLYPPNQSLEDGMDLDMIRSKDGQIVECKANQKRPGDQSLASESVFCQLNREHIEGVRILPSSILSPPKLVQNSINAATNVPVQSARENDRSLDSPVLMEREIKDYGISNNQKMAITSRLCGPSKAIRATDMDGWEQGEHEFFEDQVKAMGLDYDYCIEDVDSDDENGTAQFFAAQMKVGMPKCIEEHWTAREISSRDSILTTGPYPRDNHKPTSKYLRPMALIGDDDGEQFDGFVLFSEKAEEFERFTGHWQPDWGLFFRFNLAQKDYFGFRLAGGPADLDKDPPDTYGGRKFWDKTKSDDESMEDDEPLDQTNSKEDEDFRVMEEKAHRYRLRSDMGVALKPYHRSNPPKKGKHHRKGSIIKDASFYKIDKENWPTNGLNESSRSISETNASQLHGPMVEINMDTSGNNQSEDVSLDVNTVAMHGEDNTIMGENTTTRLHGSLSMGREINYNEVFLNKEYSGDSILDNISKIIPCVNVLEGALLEEMEVNSACRDTLIHTAASDSTGEGIHLNCAVDTNIDMFQRTDENIWENFCMQPTSINWPIVWSNPSERNLDNVMWSHSVSRASKDCLSQENNELGTGWKALFTHLLSQLNQHALNFFDGNKTMLDCLEKWAGGLNTKDHEVWRKIKEPNGKRVRWLDGEPELCHPEEAIQRKKNKKQKKKGANPFLSQQGGGTTGKNEGDTNGEDIRKRHKIWFTRNRRHEKNKPPQPICFSQEIIPNRAPLNFLGLGKFHAGRVHTKDSQSKTKCRESHMSKLDPLFGDLVARKERLREIVANIATTYVNKALVNSILGMKQFKVLKFSAKMNADGKVTIDENMVEEDQGPEVLKDPQQAQAPMSYAGMLSGMEEGIRKGGQRDYGNGRQSGQGFKPNGSGYARMASNGNTRDKGNIGNFMYTRNIVNNQRSQENQGNTKHTEDREGMDKPDHKGQNSMATNGTSSKVDELLKTGDRGNREEAQKVRLVETRNRFVLLNEEGEDIEGDNTTHDKPTNMNEEPDKSNNAWKRKQERIVNAKFRTHTTQEERFEAKRYILDGLVPVFEFGEGLQAVSRERLNSWKTHGMEMDNDEEEVDSEMDGTADLMKTDGPASLDSNSNPNAGPNEFLANRMSLEDGIPSGEQNCRRV